jgi:segregation and condensation protein A
VQPTIHVKTEVFEGPLDLLLNLIEKRKLLINEISLAQVADEYVDYLKRHPEFPLGETAHFLLVASTLVLIKSKSLLPQLELSSEEQESVDELEERLRLYQIFRDAGKGVQARFGTFYLFEPLEQQGRRRRAELTEEDKDPRFHPDQRCTREELRAALGRVIEALPPSEAPTPKAVVAKVVSLEEMIDRLSERVTRSLRTSFREFSGHGREEKVNVVVSFLAMLELVKQGMLRVEQGRHFDDILIESNEVTMPHYG